MPPEPPGADVIVKAARGNEEAIITLVQHYHRPLLNFLLRMGCDPYGADDVVQETFIKALRALPAYRHQGNFEAWLYRIALNTFRDHVRRNRGRRETPLKNDDQRFTGPDSTQAGVEHNLEKERLREALFSLPEEQRIAVVLRFYHGFSVPEIAATCNCPLSTAKSRLRLAMTRLRKQLAPKLVARNKNTFRRR